MRFGTAEAPWYTRQEDEKVRETAVTPGTKGLLQLGEEELPAGDEWLFITTG